MTGTYGIVGKLSTRFLPLRWYVYMYTTSRERQKRKQL
jgi:hypothetical protein